jgi:uncharacterized surface protein with fasciclin (FAS1) repeats
MKKIIETAIADGSFKTLVTAVKDAGLTETLSGPGPFTVFAPNDEAFAKLPKGAIEALLKDIPKLKQVVNYHVLAGKVGGGDVKKLTKAKTVQGQDIAVTSNNGVKVNDAKVIQTDIACENGVIHVIDSVLTLPTAKSVAI